MIRQAFHLLQLASLTAAASSQQPPKHVRQRPTIQKERVTPEEQARRRTQVTKEVSFISMDHSQPLGWCEGDCDSDADCGPGLTCFQRDALQAVPGCTGSETSFSGFDFCYNHASTYGQLDYQGENPSITLGPCQGDCDSDMDCADGLLCYRRRGEFSNGMVPGCSIVDDIYFGEDFCYDPKQGLDGTEVVSPTPVPPTPTDSPVAPTNSPVAPTDAPVAPTEAPVMPTAAPVPQTAPPVAPTEAPVTPTAAPVPQTAAPVAPTEAPVTPTAAPVPQTAAPVAPTEAPVTPTEAPVVPVTSPPVATPIDPNLPIDFLGTGPSTNLGRCQGDCDSDADCGPGLYCFQRDDLQEVPGCSGSTDAASGYDFCYAHFATHGPLVYIAQDPGITLGACMGDCDSDADCADGLVCYYRRNEYSSGMVPGCSMDDGSLDGNDFCYDPTQGIDPSVTLPPITPTAVPVASPTVIPVSPTASPVAPTQAPVTPTLAPILETATPVAATDAPAAPTQAPVAPTLAPVAPTLAPVAPTQAPLTPTQAPVAPTQAPVAPTQAPVTPTQAPVAPTTPPVAPTSPPVASWTNIFFESFEDDSFGIFNNAGKQTKIDDKKASDGSFSLEIKDDKGDDSASQTDLIDVASYNELRINFWYYGSGADYGESFYLEWSPNGDSNWQTIRTYAEGQDFQDGTWTEATQTWDVSGASSGRVRFRSGFNDGKEKIILDEILLEGR